jgi:hypothetical protein
MARVLSLLAVNEEDIHCQKMVRKNGVNLKQKRASTWLALNKFWLPDLDSNQGPAD